MRIESAYVFVLKQLCLSLLSLSLSFPSILLPSVCVHLSPGLSWMSLQFGFLSYLVFQEYDWDIMEPVTYFVGYGTSILLFTYFILTRQVYIKTLCPIYTLTTSVVCLCLLFIVCLLIFLYSYTMYSMCLSLFTNVFVCTVCLYIHVLYSARLIY